MKLVALEEHFATPEIMAEWKRLPPDRQDLAVGQSDTPEIAPRLYDLTEGRIAEMDASGVDVQVLSLTTPAVQVLEGWNAIEQARRHNDLVAATIRAHPDRFQGFATLPISDPAEAARELERSIRALGLHGAMLHGAVPGRNLDHPDFLPIFTKAAELRAPIYLHPSAPPRQVRQDYYDGFDEMVSIMLAGPGIGWHYHDGIQALRLTMSGIFDRLPGLQLILGHWGEVVLFYLERIDLMNEHAGLQRSISSYFASNMYVTGSGLFSQRYLRWCGEVIGFDRVMFSVDHPFVTPEPGQCRRLLSESGLDLADQERIASGNWDRLCAGIRR